MATAPSQLRLGSSFGEFTSAMRLDPSSVEDVGVYHIMLVQLISHGSPVYLLLYVSTDTD